MTFTEGAIKTFFVKICMASAVIRELNANESCDIALTCALINEKRTYSIIVHIL